MRKISPSVPKIIFSAIFLMAALCVLSLFLGKYPLTVQSLMAGDAQSVKVFLTLRVPRTIMAMAGGFGLGIAGSVYQTIFCNPLASPDIIGVSSGASAGAAFSILFFSSAPILVTLCAFTGGLTAVVLSLTLSFLAPGRNKISMVLAGVAIHSLAQTFLMFLKLTADPEKQLASIEYWIMGSLSGISLYRLPVNLCLIAAAVLLLLLLHRQSLLLTLEEEEARMLGVLVGRMRLLILILATILTASVISLTGLISFVGLLAPHTARLLTKDNRISTLLLSGITGSILLLTADMLARSLADSELPVSIFTSLLGAPFLIYLMLRKEDAYEP